MVMSMSTTLGVINSKFGTMCIIDSIPCLVILLLLRINCVWCTTLSMSKVKMGLTLDEDGCETCDRQY